MDAAIENRGRAPLFNRDIEGSTTLNRRRFLAASALLPLAATHSEAQDSQSAATPSDCKATKQQGRGNSIAVSAYFFWRFGEDSKLGVDAYIDEPARLGFDIDELLHMQMDGEEPAYLHSLKRRAFANGLPLCGLSTHQMFLSPDVDVRRQIVAHTIRCIRLAFAIGNLKMRVDTSG